MAEPIFIRVDDKCMKKIPRLPLLEKEKGN